MRRTVFLVGHAQLPQGAAAKQMFDTLALTAEIDHKYGVIVRADCTLATAHASSFVSSILVGCSLLESIDAPIEEIRRHYQGVAQNALVAALKDVQRDFMAWRVRQGLHGTLSGPSDSRVLGS